MKKKLFVITIITALVVIITSGYDRIQAAGNDNIIWLVKPQFNYADNFFEGTVSIKKDRKYSYINRNGEEVKKLYYEGLAVEGEDDKQGFINYGYKNKAGKFLIKPQFASAEEFKGGLAKASIRIVIGNLSIFKYGYINKIGAFISKPEYDELSDFHEGLAAVKKFNKWGFIDNKGREVVKPQFKQVNNFSEGLAAVKPDKEWGYINKEGKFVIEPQFGWGCDFSGGMAKVKKGLDIGDEWGYINTTGKYVIKPKFDSLYDFHDGLALFSTDKNVKCGYVNREGKIVIEEVRGEDFSEGLAYVSKKGKSGIINTKGEFVFETPDYAIYNISEGLFRIYKDGRYGFIDREGNIIIEPVFEDAHDFCEGAVCVKINGKWGYIKNPIPGEKQEQWLEQRGMKIGTVKSVSKSEIIVEGNDIPGNIVEGDTLCLFSGEAIVILRLTSGIQAEIQCEVISGNLKRIKPGMKVYKYKKVVYDTRYKAYRYL